MSDRPKTSFYAGMAIDLWTGRSGDSPAAFLLVGIWLFLLFFFMFYWQDVLAVLDFVYQLVRQPIYGSCALLFTIRMVIRCRNTSKKKSSI